MYRSLAGLLVHSDSVIREFVRTACDYTMVLYQ